MKRWLIILLFLMHYMAYGQESLSPIRFNNMLLKQQKITTRASSSDTNIFLNLVKVNQLPFFDDFSTNKTTDIYSASKSLGKAYYLTGSCINEMHWTSSVVPFNKKAAYSYSFNGIKVDSILLPISNIYVHNNVLDCNSGSVYASLYPAYYRYGPDYYTSGIKKDSMLIYDTTLTLAYVKFYNTKDQFNWMDRYAYINRTYPYNPPSMGVATMDGLNEKGRPYNTSLNNADGEADYLTSTKIDLSTVANNDTSVYLSFYIEPQGYGDYPDVKDSLILQLKDSTGRWNEVWAIPGISSRIDFANMQFTQYMINVPRAYLQSDPFYFHKDFQFRFHNYATISGNNDHWNIDYVRLDKNRKIVDTGIKNDVAFLNDLPSVLKNYTLLPAKQFLKSRDLKDSILVISRDNDYISQVYRYNYNCKFVNNNLTLVQPASSFVYQSDYNKILMLQPKLDLNFPSTVLDSSYYQTTLYTEAGDAVVTNDTARSTQFFFNEMAYDDGSAEWCYGIEGLGLKKVAYKFKVAVPDTLAAIKILFSNIDVNVQNLIFNLQIWKNIGMDGASEVILKTIESKKPIYIDTLNQFYVFGLDTPITVQDSFYIGWSQTDERNLQIGYDRNSTLGLQQLFIFTNNQWSKSKIVSPGSPMIRAILDGKRDYRTYPPISSIAATTPRKYTIYPNPVSDILHIEVEGIREVSYQLVNLLGQQIQSGVIDQKGLIDLSSIESGIYMLMIEEERSNKFSVQKIIVER